MLIFCKHTIETAINEGGLRKGCNNPDSIDHSTLPTRRRSSASEKGLMVGKLNTARKYIYYRGTVEIVQFYGIQVSTVILQSYVNIWDCIFT